MKGIWQAAAGGWQKAEGKAQSAKGKGVGRYAPCALRRWGVAAGGDMAGRAVNESMSRRVELVDRAKLEAGSGQLEERRS